MSVYTYQLIQPLILLNTLISLLVISHQTSAIIYQPFYKLFTIFIKHNIYQHVSFALGLTLPDP